MYWHQTALMLENKQFQRLTCNHEEINFYCKTEDEIAYIITGSMVVETIFTVGGIGSKFVASIGNRDYPVVQAIVIYIASTVVIMNTLADIAYQKLDPRVR